MSMLGMILLPVIIIIVAILVAIIVLIIRRLFVKSNEKDITFGENVLTICAKCGAPLVEGKNFCTKCGTKINN